MAGKIASAAFGQAVIGNSPATPCATWAELSAQIGWDDEDYAGNAIRRETLDKSWKDLTGLLLQEFAKLGAILTVLVFIFAFGRDALNPAETLSAALAVIATVVAMATTLWAISPRLKVFKRPGDWAMAALSVKTPAQRIWLDYQWFWHRQRTWLSIQRMTLFVVILCVIVLGIFAWNIVPWVGAYHAVLGWFGL